MLFLGLPSTEDCFLTENEEPEGANPLAFFSPSFSSSSGCFILEALDEAYESKLELGSNGIFRAAVPGL